MKFKTRNLLFACVMGAGLAGCVRTPVDGQAIENRQAKVGYSGTHTLSNRTVSIQALNNSTSSYVTLGSTVSGWALTDSAGTKWYTWAKSVSLPTGNSYWTTSGNIPNRKATISTRAYDPGSSLSFASFDLYGTICLASYIQEDMPGFDMMYDCSSGNTVDLTLWCGAKNQPCCPNSKGPCNLSSLECEDDLCVKHEMVVDPGPKGPVVRPPTPGVTCSDMVGAPCETPVSGCTNTSGLTKARGLWKCDSSNNAVCEIKEWVNYCKHCGTGTNPKCGECPGAACKDSLQCEPGSKCVSGRCEMFCIEKKQHYCWEARTDEMDPPPAGAKSGDYCLR